jgi:hypothetical protein
VGILKQGKRATDPDSYRLIGLECCLLKVLTLLIDRRLLEWVRENDVVPNTQNGFRQGKRTNNNSFILRCAIEKAWAEGKSLYVVFVDLKNAFPATDLPTLWAKLYRAGVSGPLFDWLRMLYARMTYVVRHGGDYSEAFKSAIGVLTGDSASPGLWNIFFADLFFPTDSDDVTLDGTPVSHVEQADDVALFSTSSAGVQRRVNAFFAWCSVNFMVISVLKTEWMLFGPLPRVIPTIYVGAHPITLVHEYKYVGVWYTSVTGHILSKHYSVKASKARSVAFTAFTLESIVGVLPPREGLILYKARVDPHLTAGCEVVLDVDLSLLSALEKPQKYFLRRLLGLNPRSVLAILYTETGILPIRYRRIVLALRYAKYLVGITDQRDLARAALKESLSLARLGHSCWLSDLRWVLGSLPVPVFVDFSAFDTTEGIDGIIDDVVAACNTALQTEIGELVKTHLLKTRLEYNDDGILETLRCGISTKASILSIPKTISPFRATSSSRLPPSIRRYTTPISG